jgi:hypothetical protein
MQPVHGPETINIHVTPNGTFTAPPTLQVVGKYTNVNWNSDQGYSFAVKFKGSSPFADGALLIQDNSQHLAAIPGNYHYSVTVFDAESKRFRVVSGCPELEVDTN